MRGFGVGLWYLASGFGDFINVSGKYLFSCQGERHCLSLYYYILKSVIILIILIVFLILAKRYKFRVRENEVNIHINIVTNVIEIIRMNLFLKLCE